MNKLLSFFAGTGLAFSVLCAPARAQIPVTDAANLQQETLKLLAIIKEVATAEQQLQQATALLGQTKSIYDAANHLTQINSIGAALNDPLLRQFLPPDVAQMSDLVSGSTSGQYSSLNGVAQAFASANRILSPSTVSATADPGAAFLDQTLNARANTIASSMAQGQSVFQAATARLAGLEQLRLQLDSSHDAKDTNDLQARIAVEKAEINNDIMRLQGLEMMQRNQLASYDQQQREAELQRSADMQALYKAGATTQASAYAPNGN